MTIEYAVVGKNGVDGLTERHTLKQGQWDTVSPQHLAELCAKDYHDNHDGWAAYWPLDFVVFAEGQSLGIFRVAQEYNPVFTAFSRSSNAV